MVAGKCKRCLEEKPLRNSHLMSNGLYKICHPPEYEPVLFSETSFRLRHSKLRTTCYGAIVNVY
jgi:hypothetical protein